MPDGIPTGEGVETKSAFGGRRSVRAQTAAVFADGLGGLCPSNAPHGCTTRTSMAVAQARERVASATKILEEDAVFQAAQRRKSFLRRLTYALRH
ncbi:hypothetical protein OG921_00985 [Aldersonia sp. NBC_00410]|uniref:hypothetical protein n=1 Tax=Aldersonia sp. NBC_00410 TaxID=2975954 RepID=UPI00224D8F1E|nr:hypothetical protein [Aldersonia sp. NBC_00410]MCX5041765.1 hypothetical protein [Aldersonia sp. NBC_00410]